MWCLKWTVDYFNDTKIVQKFYIVQIPSLDQYEEIERAKKEATRIFNEVKKTGFYANPRHQKLVWIEEFDL